MTIARFQDPDAITRLPDHTQLPESDGTFVKNFQEHPQSILLTDSIKPVLQRLHPDGHYAIGQDSGIYWRITEPPERGAECPDWFYVPNVPPMLNGQFRRSYVMWQEYVAPLIVLEFVSGDGSEERDKTPPPYLSGNEATRAGMFWVYEQAIRVPFYGIFEARKRLLEMYHLVEDHYERMSPNDRGHYPIPQMQVEVGLWQGQFQNMDAIWIRWWDLEGNLLPTGDERAEQAQQQAEQAQQRAEQAQQQAEQAQQRAAVMAERLRQLGIDPDAL